MSTTRTRIAVVAAPGAPLDDGWEATCRRWGEEAAIELVAVEPDADPDRLRNLGDDLDGVVVIRGDGDEADALVAAATSLAQAAVVDLLEMPDEEEQSSDVRTISGRGFGGVRWALRHLAAWQAQPAEVRRYGRSAVEVADLRVPDRSSPAPVAILVHGGFWRDAWGRDTLDGVAADLTERGFLTWNVEYRRLGPSGGGWPTTWDDVATAVDTLCALERDEQLGADLSRVVVIGHSVGAALALWLASRPSPQVQPSAAVSLAGVLDLRYASRMALGEATTTALLGEPSTHPSAYEATSPAERAPIGVPTLLVHGSADVLVPPVLSDSYAAVAASVGDDIEVLRVDGDHFDVIDPYLPIWDEIAAQILRLVEPGVDG